MRNKLSGMITGCKQIDSEFIALSFCLPEDGKWSAQEQTLLLRTEHESEIWPYFKQLPVFRLDGSVDVQSFIGLRVYVDMVEQEGQACLTKIALDTDYYGAEYGTDVQEDLI